MSIVILVRNKETTRHTWWI